MTQINWKTKVEYYDIDNGEQITEKEAKTNYTILQKTEKNVSVQNGHGTIKYTKLARRIYARSLYEEPNE